MPDLSKEQQKKIAAFTRCLDDYQRVLLNPNWTLNQIGDARRALIEEATKLLVPETKDMK